MPEGARTDGVTPGFPDAAGTEVRSGTSYIVPGEVDEGFQHPGRVLAGVSGGVTGENLLHSSIKRLDAVPDT